MVFVILITLIDFIIDFIINYSCMLLSLLLLLLVSRMCIMYLHFFLHRATHVRVIPSGRAPTPRATQVGPGALAPWVAAWEDDMGGVHNWRYPKMVGL